MLAETFAAKLRVAAATAMELGDLEAIARGPLPQARRALRRFPGIAEPGGRQNSALQPDPCRASS
jgi:hypothetical protein